MYKKVISIFLISSFMAISCPAVFAQTDLSDVMVEYESQKFFEEEAKIVEPGILPNSFWYWADVFGEQLKFMVVIGKESKGDFLIEVAEERLAELKALTEAGVNKYAERLISKHQESITKAEELYKLAKVKGVEKLIDGQSNLEKQIILNELKLKKKAKDAPAEYEKGKLTVMGKVGAWFKGVLSHLKWKRGKIEDSEAEYLER